MPDNNELTDSKGRPLHGRALLVARAGEQRRQAEAEQQATVRAVAGALVRLVSGHGLPGPDALRNLIGADDALRVLRMAGVDPMLAAGGWEAAAPVRRQASAQFSNGYAGDPDHDPRVLAVLQRGSDAELAAIRAQVHEEYKIRAMEKAARDRDYYGLDVPAAIGVSQGSGGVPLQTSVTHTDVPALGSEQ